MSVSVFDLYKIGIGPSSSHTLGPMRAARTFAAGLDEAGALEAVASVRVTLHGSLAATARGHATDRAVLLGLLGETPEEVEPESVDALVAGVRRSGRLALLGRHEVPFAEGAVLRLELEPLSFHPNGLVFEAFGPAGDPLAARTFFSIGGGFVVEQGAADTGATAETAVPHPYRTAEELLAACERAALGISGVVRLNEGAFRPEAETEAGLLRIWGVMQECVRRGCRAEGALPGGLGVKRRAPALFRKLTEFPESGLADPLTAIDWVSLYALAVNEENAAGSRVVTAPTNGAAGILPAVLHYYRRFVVGATDAGVVRMLLTAGAIGLLCKEGASISGAEVGCQGEVGSACSMAAGALAEVLGGTPEQAANAAEIAMEHNLGLTCDPVGGLVQVPCIERNAMAAVKAINAARLALRGDGHAFVSLDDVIRTMRDTGLDMKSKYKETARGGLAVRLAAHANVSVGLPDC
ncbi:MAG: L-serine ammonia-lyase [Thermoanaerobaculia bacterium]|jgi:L-serine dehydratase|nr:L-serine ammonia-lyase [Thermoanaerobaculia bacterium]